MTPENPQMSGTPNGLAKKVEEARKGRDVKVNGVTLGLVDSSGHRVLVDFTNDIRESLESRMRDLVVPFIRRVKAQRGIRGGRDFKIRDSAGVAV